METLTRNGVIATALVGPMVSGQANAHMAHLERRLLFWRGEWELNCTGATPTKRKTNFALVQSVFSCGMERPHSNLQRSKVFIYESTCFSP